MYVNVFSLNDFVLWHKLSLSGFYVNINQQDMRKPPNFSSAEVNQSFTGPSFAPAFLTLYLSTRFHNLAQDLFSLYHDGTEKLTAVAEKQMVMGITLSCTV